MDVQPTTGTAQQVEPTLLSLVYELLDAHQDTVRLGAARIDDPLWHAHECYLRDLQRVGREALARFAAGTRETN